MARMRRAVSGRTTCRSGVGRLARTTSPSAFTTSLTTYGRINIPSFASAPYAHANCSGVTATPWPKLTVASLMRDHRSGRMPAISPGRSMPVGCPSPNACK